MLIPGRIYVFLTSADKIPLYSGIKDSKVIRYLKMGDVFILLQQEVISISKNFRKILINDQVGYAMIYEYEFKELCAKETMIF